MYLQAVELLKMVLLGRPQEIFIVSSSTNVQMLKELNMQWGIMGMISLVENQNDSAMHSFAKFVACCLIKPPFPQFQL